MEVEEVEHQELVVVEVWVVVELVVVVGVLVWSWVEAQSDCHQGLVEEWEKRLGNPVVNHYKTLCTKHPVGIKA